MGRPKSVFLESIKCAACGISFQPKRRESKVCSKECTSTIIAAKKRKYTPEQEEQAIALRAEGLATPDITARTGIERDALKKLFRERGILMGAEDRKVAQLRRWLNYEPIVDGKKRCAQCEQWLPTDHFSMDNHRVSKLYPYCTFCNHTRYVACAEIMKARSAKYRQLNPEKIVEKNALYYLNNIEKIKARTKQWDMDNPDKRRDITREFSKRNPYLKRARTAAYRAQLRQAMPSWLTKEQMTEIKHIYRTCPPGYHVDHIVPINGIEVKGLHVPWNLRHLPAEENLAKSNKLVLY